MSDERPAARATKNFLASGGHEFDGKTIGPFTAQRQAVASEMGMKWPWVNPDDEVKAEWEIKLSEEQAHELNQQGIRKKKFKAGESFVRTMGHYRQSYKDSVIALWLCSQVESRVDRAERKPKEALDDAYAWAKSIGLVQGTGLSGEALGLWITITNEIAESRSKPVSNKPGVGGPPEREDDSGEL